MVLRSESAHTLSHTLAPWVIPPVSNKLLEGWGSIYLFPKLIIGPLVRSGQSRTHSHPVTTEYLLSTKMPSLAERNKSCRHLLQTPICLEVQGDDEAEKAVRKDTGVERKSRKTLMMKPRRKYKSGLAVRLFWFFHCPRV